MARSAEGCDACGGVDFEKHGLFTHQRLVCRDCGLIYPAVYIRRRGEDQGKGERHG